MLSLHHVYTYHTRNYAVPAGVSARPLKRYITSNFVSDPSTKSSRVVYKTSNLPTSHILFYLLHSQVTVFQSTDCLLMRMLFCCMNLSWLGGTGYLWYFWVRKKKLQQKQLMCCWWKVVVWCFFFRKLQAFPGPAHIWIFYMGQNAEELQIAKAIAQIIIDFEVNRLRPSELSAHGRKKVIIRR